MNYSQKRTLAGRIVYIALSVMAVTVLCVTLYTFFGASKRNTDAPSVTDNTQNVNPDGTSKPTPPVPTDTKPQTPADDPAVTPPSSDVTPTDVTPKIDWTTVKLTMPVSGTVSKEHDDKTAVYSLTMNDYRVHQGIDISCSLSDEVVACADGTVKTVGNDPFMGTTVVIDHGDGMLSYYKNLGEELADGIEAGADVEEGQIIGCVGETAVIEISDEPHLHFELELAGTQIDPLDMLNYNAETLKLVSDTDDK